MAAAHYAAAASAVSASAVPHRCLMSSSEVRYSTKPNLVISCVFTSSRTRRKNRLREKILKTAKSPNLVKPSLVPVDISPHEEVSESGTVQEVQESEKCENSEAGNEEVQKLEELGEVEVSVPAGSGGDGSIGVLGKGSILKFGMWIIGAFVFQTVCAIWVFGSSGKNWDSPGNEESSVIEVGENGNDKSRIRGVLKGKGNGKMGLGETAVDSIIFVDELEMQRKIEEIRVMARKARETERLESKKDGYDSENSEEETDGEKHSKSVIEEEIDDRLIRLRRKLENSRKKIIASDYLVKDSARKDEVENVESDASEGGTLLFEKKYKFKGLSTDPVEKPKGFTGSGDYRVSKSEKSEGMGKADELFQSRNGDTGVAGLGDGEKLPELSDVNSEGSDGIHVVEEYEEKDVSEMTESVKNARGNVAKEEGMNKQGKGKGAFKPKAVLQGKNNGRPTLGAVKSRKLNAKAQKSRKSNDLIAVAPNKSSKGNNGLNDKGIGDSKFATDGKTKTDYWWLNLPYVLVIIMQRGYNGEGGEGFYVLKSISSSKGRTSHIVAFEERADATNFCYLLQSCFNDQEDFRADVVPLTAKELNETVKSGAMSAVVVKRGQLQLYAGQPLVDAEMALRALTEQG